MTLRNLLIIAGLVIGIWAVIAAGGYLAAGALQ